MKDYFNWIGCKSSKKERYIQHSITDTTMSWDVNHLKKKDISNNNSSIHLVSQDVNHLKKERYIQLGVVLALLNGRCTSSKKIGTSNFFALV